MKFANLFSSRKPTEKLNGPVLTFVREQDGPPERMLRGKLSEIFYAISSTMAGRSAVASM
jgi:hypothetical protein